MDFNPAGVRLRIVSSTGLNLRVDPNIGTVTNDTSLNGGDTGAVETAYTNSFINATATTQYTIGNASKTLYIQNVPNGGTLTLPIAVTPAPEAFLGFDIGETVTTAFASIDVVSGQLGVIGAFPFTGTLGISLANAAARPVVGLTAAGQIVSFLDTAPATLTTTAAVTAITAGETLVGLDYCPATGQLYGLGINAITNTGTLYRIDSQTAAGTAIGAAGAITFAGVDFPADGWGVDFNPSVDRVRVVNKSGQNFRINPDTGAVVDGDANTLGIQPDVAVNGDTAHLDDVAYTNGPSAAGATVEYGIDSTTGGLYLVSNPNGGVTGAKIAITVGGAALAFTAVNDFDIPSTVTTATANTAVTAGSAYASLVVGGATNLYRIDLVTGAATFTGSIGAGTNQLVGLAAGR